MKKSVIFGAGNIGRGFIGQLFSQAGYEVIFIDVKPDLVADLNRFSGYPVRIVQEKGSQDIWVSPVRAVNGSDRDVVAAEIAGCDLMATAVGVNVLQRIVPALVAGLRRRWQTPGRGPVDIIICENLIHADQRLCEWIAEALTSDEKARFSGSLGLVEASIGRMVPVMSDSQKAEHPLLVCVEPYQALPVAGGSFAGPIPDIPGLVPFEPFSFYIQRKLYIHNMGHAVCAYLGLHQGYEYTWQSMADPWLHLCVQNAMLESAAALCQAYSAVPVTMRQLTDHVSDILFRFQNKALADTNARVAADPARKLSPQDRLVGAAQLVLEQGGQPAFIALGIAAALHQLQQQHGAADSRRVLVESGGLPGGHPLLALVDTYRAMLERGAAPGELFAFAEASRAELTGPVV